MVLRIILTFSLFPFIASAADDAAVKAVNQLGLSLLRQTEGNSLISPWSLQQSLSMVYAGAKGKTRDEMKVALGYGEDATALHEGFKQLREAGDALAPAVAGVKPLRTANRLFIAKHLPLNADWLDLTKKSYAAEPQVVDFSNLPAATKTINDWVSAQTERKIPSVIPQGALDRRAKLVIVNALYFDMPWDELFTKGLTQTAPFFLTSGRTKNVPLMFKQHRQRYAHQDGFQIATLPYAGEQLQFLVILPDNANDLAKIEATLTPELLAECTKMHKAEVRLTLPRMKMEPPSMPMKGALQKLGMQAAFDSDADLTGIWKSSDGNDPMIDEIFHRTFIELDENGTKAAASTAVMLRPKNGVPHEIPHVVVRCDHPFVFAIQHVPSGACLFIGRMNDPAPDVSEDHRGPMKN
jgi:serpin B